MCHCGLSGHVQCAQCCDEGSEAARADGVFVQQHSVGLGGAVDLGGVTGDADVVCELLTTMLLLLAELLLDILRAGENPADARRPLLALSTTPI